jgi:uncharacterized protein
MKTQNTNSLSPIFKALFLVIIFFLGACTDRKATSQSKAKSPDIDIHSAVVTENLEALKQHIAAGSNLNERDPFGGSSPLISAAVFGRTEAAKILIEAGVDLNLQNNDGSTALHTAAFFCRPEIVKMLLDKKVDLTIRNKYGVTAYENVAGSFSQMKEAYDMMGKLLGPMGLTLDYAYIEKTRPEIAAVLK